MGEAAAVQAGLGWAGISIEPTSAVSRSLPFLSSAIRMRPRPAPPQTQLSDCADRIHKPRLSNSPLMTLPLAAANARSNARPGVGWVWVAHGQRGPATPRRGLIRPASR